MGITFRHDAAAVVPPSNQSTRKYGQQLVQQEQQRKYNAQQEGYNRLFTLGRDNMQNQAQMLRDNNQIAFQVNQAKDRNAFQLDRDKQQNEWRQQQQRGADFSAARARMDAHAKDALSNPDIPPELRQKIQSLVNGKMAVLGSGFNETQQQEFLDQYNSQLAALLSEIPPPQPKAPAQPNFHTDENGNRWVEEGPGKWSQVPQQEQQPQKPTSPGEAFQDKKTLDDYYKKADDYITGGDPDNRPKVTENGKERPMTPQEYHAHVNKVAGDLWGIDNPQGSATAAPPLPGAAQAPASPPQMKSILETPADMTVTPPDTGVPPSPPAAGMPPAPGAQPTQSQTAWDAIQQAQAKWNTANAGQGQNPQAASGLTPEQQAALIDGLKGGQPADNAGQSPIVRGIALAPGHPDYVPPPTPTDKRDEKGYVIMSDGSKVDPRDSAAMKSGGQQQQSIMRYTHPDGSPIERSPSNMVAAELQTSGSGRKQQVKVGGKPLAVSPGTLTPQETAARQQIMEMPREQRISALMPYDQELKGKTLDQLLEDPATKAGYAEMTKQGLTTGNYREDMLGHIDEMLQHNVLKANGTPPDAYVGMRADDITDPKVKAEVAKMPRPKTAADMKTIRGKYFVDPNGVIRGTQKQ